MSQKVPRRLPSHVNYVAALAGSDEVKQHGSAAGRAPRPMLPLERPVAEVYPRAAPGMTFRKHELFVPLPAPVGRIASASWADMQDDQSAVSNQEEAAQVERGETKGGHEPAATWQRCINFYHHGWCRFGDDCRFEHVADGPGAELQQRRLERDQRWQAKQAEKAARQQAEDKQRKVLSSNNGVLPGGKILSGDEWRAADRARQRLQPKTRAQRR